jgi:hypothetical protein
MGEPADLLSEPQIKRGEPQRDPTDQPGPEWHRSVPQLHSAGAQQTSLPRNANRAYPSSRGILPCSAARGH